MSIDMAMTQLDKEKILERASYISTVLQVNGIPLDTYTAYVLIDLAVFLGLEAGVTDEEFHKSLQNVIDLNREIAKKDVH